MALAGRGVVTDVGASLSAPAGFWLSQNYPNPFNPTTQIEFQVPAGAETRGEGSAWVELKVYDPLGRDVATLVNEQKAVGKYTVRLDGSHLTSGMYFYRLRMNDHAATKKLVVMH